MIIGIEQTTDLRYPETRIVKFRSDSRAQAWLDEYAEPPFAWPGAADSSLSGQSQNWHHRIRSAYEMPPGFRLRKRDVDEVYRRYLDRGSSMYRRTRVDAEASVYRSVAVGKLHPERKNRPS